MEFVLFIFLLPTLFVAINFVYLIVKGEELYNSSFNLFLNFVVMISLPLFFINFVDSNTNNCCSDSATFSPNHKISIYAVIIVTLIAYFYSRLRSSIQSPIVEVLINSILIIGIVFNGLMIYQIDFISIFGNYAIIMLLLIELINNQKLFMVENKIVFNTTTNKFEQMSWQILNLSPILKYPILFLISLPILIVLSSFLLLFGQKPDSLIRGFTDTYKHGFSQLDYMCDNVNCGGHFLCSVAANGHKNIVKPNRYGERGGNKIICNRQLLISNAFEDLLEQYTPKTHKVIRRNYNKVGNVIHKHYGIFNNKYVSDFIYILMKPLEWLFLLTLYIFDKNPENRIAKQYLNREDRLKIKALKI